MRWKTSLCTHAAQLFGSRVLFISPTPALSPILYAQGIPHMRELHKLYGIEFTLLTFEKRIWSDKDRKRAEDLNSRFEDWGIEWHFLRSGRMPLVPNSTSNIIRGIPAALSIIRHRKIDIVHCRSYVPAYIMLVIRKFEPVKFIFDTRNRYPDELIWDGSWSANSYYYKCSKWLETKCYHLADSIVVTNEGEYSLILRDLEDKNEREIIERKMALISNATDMTRFHPDMPTSVRMRKQYGLENSTVFLWLVGGIRPIHMPEETARFFRVCKRRFPNSRLLVLTWTPTAENILQKAGLKPEDYLILSVNPEEVPRFILMGDVGLSFFDLRHTASAIKLAEYLACGLPVVVNRGQGFVEELVASNKTGVVVAEFSEDAYRRAADDLACLMAEGAALSLRCRAIAEENYSLEIAVQQYAEVYQNVLT